MKVSTVGTAVLVLATFAYFASTGLAQTATPDRGCAGQIVDQVPRDASELGRGIITVPRNAVRPQNLKWELPIAAAAGVLIGWGDHSGSRRIQSLPFQDDARLGSNIVVGKELGTAALMYGVPCAKHRSSYARDTGLIALEAMGAANLEAWR
jgi:hypothetical protein